MNTRRAGALLRCSQCAASIGYRTSAQQRLFATSTVLLRHGAVPSFSEVSSPELGSLLKRVREELFLPAHLSDSQKLLIEKPKYRKQLEAESSIATIAGEDFKLKPLPLDGRPNVRKALAQAMELFREKKDWETLPNLIQGTKTVTGTSSPVWKTLRKTVILKLGNAGRQNILLELVRRGSDTGFTMSSREFTKHIFMCFGRKAYENDFDEAHTEKALLYAEQAAALMENPEHAGNTSLAGDNDPRLSPEIMGILLELAAVRASKHLGGKDKGGKVASYTEKLLNTPVAFKPLPDTENGYILHEYLYTYIPILYGMNLAQSLQPGTKYAEELRSRAYKLSEDVSECRNRLVEWEALEKTKEPQEYPSPLRNKKNRPLYGLTMYDKLIGS